MRKAFLTFFDDNNNKKTIFFNHEANKIIYEIIVEIQYNNQNPQKTPELEIDLPTRDEDIGSIEQDVFDYKQQKPKVTTVAKASKEGEMLFVTARCPQCGGELQLDSNKATAFCMHCGTKIIVQEAINAVRLDNTHMIDTWMKMGDTAYEGENFSEAYEYYRKIIEVQPDNWQAIYKKGKAAGWQSTIANLRFTEATTSFAQAINLAPGERKDTLKSEVNEEVKKLALALIALRADRFEKWPDAEETAGFINDIGEILKAAIRLGEKSGFKASGFMRPIANKINSAVMYAWSTKIKRDYVGDDNRPTQYQFNQFIQRIGFCTKLIELSIGLSDEDDEEDIKAYKNLIMLHNEAINSCSWEYAGETWMGVDYKKGYELDNNAKQGRRRLIKEYESKISSIKSKIQRKRDAERQNRERKAKEDVQKRINEYLIAHPEEKQKLEGLEGEKNEITRKIIDLQEERELKTLELFNEKTDLNTRIQNCKKDLDSLGVFKIKEKKEMNRLISELQQNLKDTETKIINEQQPFDTEIDKLNGKINEIADEIRKQRRNCL